MGSKRKGGTRMEDIFSRKELISTIYREQSFSKAAQKLFIAQPSLSLMVKKLEDRLGVPLFDRTTKPIRLTEAGQKYIAAAEQMSQVENTFADYIAAVNNLEAGSLGIGSNQLLSSLVLPKYVSRFLQAHPKIQLRLEDANSTTLQNALMAGSLDIIIDNHRLPEDVFIQHHLWTEHLFLAVPEAFPENKGLNAYTAQDILAGRHLTAPLPPAPLDAFRHVPFLLMNRNNDTRTLTDTIFQELGFSPRVLLEMDRLATLYSYIEMDTGASVVSDTLIRNIRGADRSRVRFYPLPTRHAKRRIFVSYKRNKHITKAMRAFMDMLGTLA